MSVLTEKKRAAARAAERHGLVRAAGGSVAVAVRTAHAGRPAAFDEPLLGGCVVREHPHQVDQRDPVAVVLPWRFVLRSLPCHIC